MLCNWILAKFLLAENDRELEKLSADIKEERQARKSAESQLKLLQEEMAETKATKDALEKVSQEVTIQKLSRALVEFRLGYMKVYSIMHD